MSASKEAICSSSEKDPEKPQLGKFHIIWSVYY